MLEASTPKPSPVAPGVKYDDGDKSVRGQIARLLEEIWYAALSFQVFCVNYCTSVAGCPAGLDRG